MAEFSIELDLLSFPPVWIYMHSSNKIMVTLDKGNTFSYQETLEGDVVSMGTQLNSSQLETALENLIGEEVTFISTSEGFNPISE